jgi:hypothetical protein
MKTKTSLTINSMNRPSRHCGTVAFLLIPLALAYFALSPAARAECNKGCKTGQSTVVGFNALNSLTTGFGNTAMGYQALESNTDRSYNTAFGYQALEFNVGVPGGDYHLGAFNTATGYQALWFNTTGYFNTANGFYALGPNTSGAADTATGYRALEANTTGFYNTGDGYRALDANRTGNYNTSIGASTLRYSTGSCNIALGCLAGFNLTTGDNNIDIGNQGVATDANTIRIGGIGACGSPQTATFIAGIYGTAVAGDGVVVDANGQLGVQVSSERFKDEIKPMDKASEAILALKPVTFHYKKELDPAGIQQFGLVAEQVEKVNPDLVTRDAQGKPYTVRYEAVNAMLLNEFLKEHRKVEALEATVAQQQKGMETLAASLKKQAAQIQAVNERLERAAPLQVVDKQ